MTLLKHTTLPVAIAGGLILAGCESSHSVVKKAPSPTPSIYARVSKPEVKTAPPLPKLQPGEEVAVIETAQGKIKLQLFADIAPKHVEHFKKRINEGFYNGLAFHRAVPNLMVQGGDPNSKSNDRSKWGLTDDKLEKVNAEFSDRPIVKGTLAAARSAFDPHSASTQFFICASAYPSWTGQYTNFGQVIAGQDIVQAMSKAPTDNRELLKNKIVMTRVYLEKYSGK
jgi:cyclophilin family peptidyl-prolyl cis-trans isomerase